MTTPSYALASSKLESLLREVRRNEELIVEYQQICLDLQAEVVDFLARFRVNLTEAPVF